MLTHGGAIVLGKFTHAGEKLRAVRRALVATPRAWRTARRALLGLSIGGLIAGLLGWTAAGQAAFGCGLLGLVLLESSQLRRSIQENERQHQALIQIRPLAG